MNTKYPQRKQLRLKNYDYSRNGVYFVTICTQNRNNYFIEYPQLRKIVSTQWYQLPDRFPDVTLDEFFIMPNHVHGIIRLVGAPLEGARFIGPTIGDIIGAYKSLCAHEWLKYIRAKHLDYYIRIWQRNYFERIVRDENDLRRIREYIRNNPLMWGRDRNNPMKVPQQRATIKVAPTC